MPAKKTTTKLTIPAAILQVMEANGKPMTAKAICAEVVALGAGAGKTPAASCSAKLYTEAKKVDGMVLRTKNKGEFKLNPKRRVKKTAA